MSVGSFYLWFVGGGREGEGRGGQRSRAVERRGDREEERKREGIVRTRWLIGLVSHVGRGSRFGIRRRRISDSSTVAVEMVAWVSGGHGERVGDTRTGIQIQGRMISEAGCSEWDIGEECKINGVMWTDSRPT